MKYINTSKLIDLMAWSVLIIFLGAMLALVVAVVVCGSLLAKILFTLYLFTLLVCWSIVRVAKP